MSQPFARVRRSARCNVLAVTALLGGATDDEFDALITEAEAAYLQMPPNFVLVFDLTRMETLSASHATKWMRLFERVKPVTRTHLLCTHVAIANPAIVLGAQLFLRLYNPVKPFHMHETREDAFRAARSEAEAVQDRVVDGHVEGDEGTESGQDRAAHPHAESREHDDGEDARD